MNNQQGVMPAANISTVQYMLRRNLGNYEHEEITLSGAVREGADPMTAVNHLKVMAKMALYADPEVKAQAIQEVLKTQVVADKKGLVEHKVKLADSPKAEATFVKEASEPAPSYPQADGTTSEVPGDVPPPIPAEAKTKAKKEKAQKVAQPKIQSQQAEDEQYEEVPSPYKAHPSETKSEEPTESVKTDAKAAGAEKVKTTKTAPHISYDRNVKEHRSTFATYLNTNHKGWQTKKPEAEIAKFSAGLHGVPFMDTKGTILDSFKTKLTEFFA